MMKKIKQIVKELLNHKPNEQLIKNLKKYDEKEKAKQQKSKVQNSNTNKS